MQIDQLHFIFIYDLLIIISLYVSLGRFEDNLLLERCLKSVRWSRRISNQPD